MRRVPIDMLTPDMELGRAISTGTQTLINAGVKDLGRYTQRLQEMGINFLYIEDEASEGIEIDELITSKTRMQCKKSIANNFVRLENNLSVDLSETTGVAKNLFEEILSHNNVLYDLNEIGSMGDNTLDHSLNTTIYAICLAIQMKYDTDKIIALALGTLLHDIGKTELDHSILFKPGKLTKEEFSHIKKHPELGYCILNKDSKIDDITKEICLFHHERMDGSGYPYGLRGDELPEMVKICSIVDVFEALTVRRCYHEAIEPIYATEILTKEAGKLLDFDLVSVFLKNIAVYPTGSMVLLSNGQRAVVKKQNPSFPLRPVVRTIEIINNKCTPKEELNLMEKLNITIARPVE